jgi:hypothetical protein
MDTYYIRDFLFTVVPVLGLAGMIAFFIWVAVKHPDKKPPDNNPPRCPKCGGDPNFIVYTSQGSGPCPYCQGRGTVNW